MPGRKLVGVLLLAVLGTGCAASRAGRAADEVPRLTTGADPISADAPGAEGTDGGVPKPPRSPAAPWTCFDAGLFPGAELFGPGYDLRGIGLGLLVQRSGDMAGIQISTLGSSSTGDGYGIQVSGLFSSSGEDFVGVQVSGLASLTGEREGEGMSRRFHVTGLQVAIGANFGNIRGVQLALLGNGRFDLEDFHLSRPGSVAGGQIALANGATRLEGVQIGFGNEVSQGGAGVQLGVLLNVAKRFHGIQIGLINVNDRGFLPFFPLVNFSP